MKNRIRALAALLFALWTLIVSAPAAAANCTPAERAAADRQLWLSRADQAASVAQHLPWGVPRETGAVDNERLLVLRDFVIRHDGDLRVPLWTAERVDHSRLGNVGREDCFRADPRLPAVEAATPRDYDEPIYDQGHMAPFANQSTSQIAGHNSFIMSNMAPQTCQLNRGIWQILEGITRLWAAEHGTVYVLSGSVFDRDGNGARDPDEAAERMVSRNGGRRVAVPSHFYKVIAVRRPDNSVSTLSIMLPHDAANPDGAAALRYLTEHLSTIEEIEQVAGIDLFPAGAEIEESRTLWPFQGRQPRSLCNVGRTN
ncbi:MAG TPA: DNA/RNA non-specific endonuclease [Allosphingosinicella sp.]|jgi:endonuclease G